MHIYNEFWAGLRHIHTKNDNYKDNYISIHTSRQYRLLILSARVSAGLNSQDHYSRIDTDWVSVFLPFIRWKKIWKVLKVIPMIMLLCAFIFTAVLWTLPFSYWEWFLELYHYLYSYHPWCEQAFTTTFQSWKITYVLKVHSNQFTNMIRLILYVHLNAQGSWASVN